MATQRPRLPDGYPKPKRAAKWLLKYQGCQMATQNPPRLPDGYPKPTRPATCIPKKLQRATKTAEGLPKTYRGREMATHGDQRATNERLGCLHKVSQSVQLRLLTDLGAKGIAVSSAAKGSIWISASCKAMLKPANPKPCKAMLKPANPRLL
jgi:hypothetical protein